MRGFVRQTPKATVPHASISDHRSFEAARRTGRHLTPWRVVLMWLLTIAAFAVACCIGRRYVASEWAGTLVVVTVIFAPLFSAVATLSWRVETFKG